MHLRRPGHNLAGRGLQVPGVFGTVGVIQVREDRHEVDVAVRLRRAAGHRPEQQHLFDARGDQPLRRPLRINPGRRLSRRNDRHETSLPGGERGQ